jgi:polar amino acid transport system substrate-binding protein
MNPLEIEQAIVNLIRNAIESQERGAQITLHREVDESWVRFKIHDNGRGIQPHDLSQVLDPFFTTRLAEGGTGLGLSVAHGVVSDHGGRLEIESTPGEGCTVTFELPLALASG